MSKLRLSENEFFYEQYNTMLCHFAPYVKCFSLLALHSYSLLFGYEPFRQWNLKLKCIVQFISWFKWPTGLPKLCKTTEVYSPLCLQCGNQGLQNYSHIASIKRVCKLAVIEGYRTKNSAYKQLNTHDSRVTQKTCN